MPSNQTEKHETNGDTTCVDTIDLTIRITCRVLRSETRTTGKLQGKELYRRALRFDAREHKLSAITKEGTRPFEMSHPNSSKP